MWLAGPEGKSVSSHLSKMYGTCSHWKEKTGSAANQRAPSKGRVLGWLIIGNTERISIVESQSQYQEGSSSQFLPRQEHGGAGQEQQMAFEICETFQNVISAYANTGIMTAQNTTEHGRDAGETPKIARCLAFTPYASSCIISRQPHNAIHKHGFDGPEDVADQLVPPSPGASIGFAGE